MELASSDAAAILFFLAGRWYRGADETARRRLRILIGILLICDELAKDLSTLATGRFECMIHIIRRKTRG